jgi:proteasome accessory factor C
MPKPSKISGLDRFNFLLSLVGYLINHKDVPVAELAAHFGVSVEETKAALETITVSGIKQYGPNDLFAFEPFKYYDEDIVDLTFSPAIDEVPRISQRQAAAMAAGLQYLLGIKYFEEQKEVHELIDILAKGTAGASIPAIEVKPGTVDADFMILRSAISNQNCVTFEYQNQRQEISKRTVEPIQLIAVEESWLLRAYAPEDSMVKSFRLDRMRSTTILDKKISAEALAAELTEEIYVSNPTDIEVIVEVTPQGMGFINYFNATILQKAENGKPTRASLSIGHLPVLGKYVARYGGAVKVVEPKLARDAVRDYALKALGGRGLNQPNHEDE